MLERVLLVALGGALGSSMRYLVAVGAARWFGLDFPWGTLLVNLTGAFLVGLIHEIATETLLLPAELRLFLATGMMGGLTTYSAFSYESVRLAQSGAWGLASMNVAGTTVACLLLSMLGIAAGRALLMLRG